MYVSYVLKAHDNLTCVSYGGWTMLFSTWNTGELIWREQPDLNVTVIGVYFQLCRNISYHRAMTVTVYGVVK